MVTIEKNNHKDIYNLLQVEHVKIKQIMSLESIAAAWKLYIFYACAQSQAL